MGHSMAGIVLPHEKHRLFLKRLSTERPIIGLDASYRLSWNVSLNAL